MQRLLFAVVFFSLVFHFDLVSEDWSHWRGENRSDVIKDASGYSDGKPWPAGSPLWRINVGQGASSPLVVGDLVYTFGWQEGQNILRAVDSKTGKTSWEQSSPGPKYGRNAVGDQNQYIGATSTPEFDSESGYLFTLSADGSLEARDSAKEGAVVWSFNLYDRFGIGRRPQITERKNTLRDYGYTSAPLVAGNSLIVEVGDPNSGNLHAFEKSTGKPLWRSENRDTAGHTGALTPLAIEGVPCVAVATSYHVLVVRLDGENAGKTVAEFPWATDFSNTIAGIAARENEVLISSRYNQMAMVKLAVSLKYGAKEIWRNQFPTGVCTPVIFEDHLYFANKGIYCVDFKTGKLVWEGGKIGDAGSCLVTSDKRLVVWGNGGDLLLAETAARSPDKFSLLAERRGILSDKGWPHVVVANERIYVKTTNGDLVSYSLKEASSATPSISSSNRVKDADLDFSRWGMDSSDGLIWSWKQGDGIARRSAAIRKAKLIDRGKAFFDEKGAMSLESGAFEVAGAVDVLVERIKKSNEFTIELLFQPVNLNQSGPARIVSLSKNPHERNFTLGQEGGNLILRLRTTKTGINGANPEVTLMAIEADRINRVCLTYRECAIVCYRDGKKVTGPDLVGGDLSNWTKDGQGFVFGDEFAGGSRDWAGCIHGVAIFDRALSPIEVERRDGLLSEP